MKKSVVFTTLAAMTLFASGEALAQSDTGPNMAVPGFNCGNTPDADPAPVTNTQQYAQGKMIGNSFALNAWYSTSMDATNVDGFIADALNIVSTIVGSGMSNLDPNSVFDQALGCRFLGILEGVSIGVSEVVGSVQQSCEADGDINSVFLAGLFCEWYQLVLDTGGTPKTFGRFTRTPSVCGVAFASSCEEDFATNARNYVSLTGNVVDCAPYVEDTAVFEEQRYNSCTYK